MPTAQEIIDYLKDNPAFFKEREELLAQLNLDLTDMEGVSPFVARQLQVLKDRESQQQAKIDLIMDGAKSNQKLEADFVEIAVRLLSHKSDSDDPVDIVSALVKRQFNVKALVIMLKAGGDGSQSNSVFHQKYDEVRQRVAHKKSVCDDRVSSTLLESLFDQDDQAIKSCAFIPLVFEDDLIGTMVLGSSSVSRFQPGVGVMFLDRLGLLVAGFLQGR